MDLRIERTKKSIAEAFLQLRKEKPIEKITVKELAERAYINKATFYLHYQDIYDLSEQLENKFIASVIKNMPSPNILISNPRKSGEELTYALMSQSEIVSTLFSGTRAPHFEDKIEKHLKEEILTNCPEIRGNLRKEMILSMLIHGGFRAFQQHVVNHKTEEIVQIMGDINECLVNHFLNE